LNYYVIYDRHKKEAKAVTKVEDECHKEFRQTFDIFVYSCRKLKKEEYETLLAMRVLPEGNFRDYSLARVFSDEDDQERTD